MTTFDEKLTKHQANVDAQYEHELDKAQTKSDKMEELAERFSDMFISVLNEKIGDVTDFPKDPDTFLEDVRDMILDMWEDYCG